MEVTFVRHPKVLVIIHDPYNSMMRYYSMEVKFVRNPNRGLSRNFSLAGLPWVWENFLAYGNSHMWESYEKSSFPHVGILWEIVILICGNPMGIPTEILWEWDGNGN